MPRANRHYIPGHVWHITHRCHKKEFLLKFAKDRQRWIDRLFEARKRYGIVVLNYMATSNHIHLLVYDTDGGEVIPKTVQLAAGRTAQEYNQRKRRKGAYWEDRYHATAVQTDHHLVQCMFDPFWGLRSSGSPAPNPGAFPKEHHIRPVSCLLKCRRLNYSLLPRRAAMNIIVCGMVP
jgi:REP element-mobilizing transposase RayT